MSNVMVHYRILFYVENCTRQSDLSVNGKQGGGLQSNNLELD